MKLARRHRSTRTIAAFFLLLATAVGPALAAHSVARQWNEELLEAIRHDLARPTVHARNLFHVSAAMYDAWAAYDPIADTYLHHEKATAENVPAARNEAISFAAYRLLHWRFTNSIGASTSLPAFDARMAALGYDQAFTSTTGDSPAALGNRIAQAYIDYGLDDGANEAGGYANLYYEPVNPPLAPALFGNPNLEDTNRWQPLELDVFIDQGGNVVPGRVPPFLSPEWGNVKPFSLSEEDLTIYQRDGHDWWVYHDPGPPPMLDTDREEEYMQTFERVLEWSSELDPTDGLTMDISPASRGNNTLGTNDGHGYEVNPRTGEPYTPEVVPRGDYFRVLAEFWADGPNSETPPGHWFTIANYVSDHPKVIKRLGGKGPVLDDLEWDVKVYFTLGGAMHDVAIAAWGVKGWYDFIRPISAIRYMGGLGQRSDPGQPSFNPHGLRLVPGRVELITADTVKPGGKHEHLGFGVPGQNIGKVAVRAWRGPNFVSDPAVDTAGVGWMLPGDWWPYQRPTFVTPPFAGYVSGHSTYSRAAAEVMSRLTGDEFFPGGMGTFPAPKNQFLVFEEGPSVDVTLEWARYRDASDECSISRIYGGIHPPADDIPGRFMGSVIGPEAFTHAARYFDGAITGNGLKCVDGETTACLSGGRFKTEITWRDFQGRVGNAHVVPYGSNDSGLFWFFDADNWEMLVKVLDGCTLNNRFWVYSAATTDVEYTLTVTDTQTGDMKTYTNTLGSASPAITDTDAFATCTP